MLFHHLFLFIVFAFVSPVLSVCPSSSCRFTLCTQNVFNFSTRPDTPSRSHVLCLNQVPIGVTNTLTGVFIPSNLPVQPPTLFKSLTLPNGTAALSYQTLADPTTLLESCVRLPIGTAQIRVNGSGVQNFVGTDPDTDCVVFEIDQSFTNPPSSPGAPSAAPLIPTPSSFSPSVVGPTVPLLSSPGPTPLILPSTEPTVPEESPDMFFTDTPSIIDPPTISPDELIPDFSLDSSPEEDNIAATVFTDPHIRTFDGLAFDCQASGEFTLVHSDALEVDIQARFSGPDTGGSVTTGVVMREGTFPVVQASISTMNSTEQVEISGCPMSFYLDGTNINPAETGSLQQGPLITLGGTVKITLPSDVSISFRPTRSSFFGCYFESLTTFIPRRSSLSGNDFNGLLGRPNGISSDDWSTEDGSTILLPGDLLFKPAYDYCTENWCIRNNNFSIFTYETGTDFSTFFRCNTPYPGPPDLSTAPPQLIQLCGNETACLIDGIVGDIDDARNALNSLQEADMNFNRGSPISFEPAALAVNKSINVLITVNVNRISDSVPSNIDSFALYRVDSATGVQGEAPILSLEDNGDPGFSDAVRGDGVFSNLLAFLSSSASETFGFRAIPVFDGVEDPDSQFVLTSLTGVRSFSSSKTTMTPNNGSRTASVPLGSFGNNSVAVKYSWGADVRDLDTGTEFLESIVGFGCVPSSEYMTTTGDDTGTAGSETVSIDVIQARVDGQWDAQTSIQMRAGWFTPSAGSGPATLRVFLIDRETMNEVEGVGISTVINPGTQDGCADTDVAELDISVEGSVVTMTLNRV